MINRKIALSAMSILTALGMTAGATFAVFTSQATSTGNTFSSGNANLQISTDNITFGASIPGATLTGLFPSEVINTTFYLKNVSTANIDLDLTADVSALNPNGDLLGDNVLLKWACDLNHANGFEPGEFSNEFSANAWFAGGAATLGTLTHGDTVACEMVTTVPASANDGIVGHSISLNAVYDATQH